MSETILVIGYGPVGAATTRLLATRGTAVKVAQRKRPLDLPASVAFTPCDVTDPASLRAAAEGASQIVLSIGLTYSGKIWRKLWPKIMGNVVEIAAATGARVVFADNLYMYGPQQAPLTEDMPLSGYGAKPAARVRGNPHLARGERDGPHKVCCAPLPGFLWAGRDVVRSRRYRIGCFGARQVGDVDRRRRHTARHRLRPRRRPGGLHSARRARRRLRPSLARPLRADANAARAVGAVRDDTRRSLPSAKPAALGARRTGRLHACVARVFGDEFLLGSAVSGRFQQIRAAFLVRRDAVRGGDPRYRVVVPRAGSGVSALRAGQNARMTR